MQTKEFFTVIKQCVNAQNWSKLDSIKRKINQKFIDENKVDLLKEYYQSLLNLVMTADEQKRIIISDTSYFEDGIFQCLHNLKTKLKKMPTLQAVYLEYFYDEGDCCTADLFLCDKYFEDNDDWACEIRNNGMIEGPNISQYFDNNCDFEMEPVKDSVMYFYIDAMLLLASINAWRKVNIIGFPFAFAAHDNRLVRIFKI